MPPNSAGTDVEEHDFGSFAGLDETSSPIEEIHVHHQRPRSSVPHSTPSMMTGGVPQPSQLIMNHHQSGAMLAPSQLISPQYL